jgi:rare lipoprotein A
MRDIAKRLLIFTACVGLLVGCGPTQERETTRAEEAAPSLGQPTEAPRGEAQTGTATVYAGMLEGRETAGGESFRHEEMVAAHRTHRIGTHVRVTNLENDRSVTVRIADRIPAGTEAIIDLSRRAAQELGIDEQGQARVRVEAID